MRQKIAAGNWKMNGTTASLSELETLNRQHPSPRCEVLICPPAPLIHRAATVLEGTAIQIGGQDCHAATSGAHTGDVSADMLTDAGARFVLVGHSERRQDHGETDDTIRAKLCAARQAGLSTILCIGETLAQREADQTLDVIDAQLAGGLPDTIDRLGTIIAYEPVWAIGTGKVPTVEQILQVHQFIRGRLEHRFGRATGGSVRLLYGGSVKADNAKAIFAVADVDGALVGGASLRAADFSPIIAALDAAT